MACIAKDLRKRVERNQMKQTLLEDKIVVVTGASCGIGKGIATQLGKYGATVYITGRTLSTSSNASSGTVDGVAEEVTAAGGGSSIRVTS
jgi:NAD(P)-dependent dehydrogenase (short-subunit alcohol dehydrogenase family)